MNRQLRQGDVFIIETKEIPKGAIKKARDNGRVVLAYGEVTGHSHAIAEKECDLLEFEGKAYLVVEAAEAILRHEEHTAIVIPNGTYEVRIQQEYSDEGF